MTAKELYLFLYRNGPRTVRALARSKGIRQAEIHALALEHPWIEIQTVYKEYGEKVIARNYGDCKLVVNHRQNVAN